MTKRIFLLCIFLLFWTTTSFAQSFWKPVFHSQDSYWADSILVNLSEEERIAQLFMVAAYSNKDEKHTEEISALIRDYKIGGLMFLQGSPTKQAQLTNYFQSISKTPLMIAQDAEWGVSMRLDSAIRFPWQMTLGAIANKKLIY